MLIRTVIVDDEPLAREGVRVRLEAEPDVEIVGEAADGPTAVQMITTLRPDLVFLDVQLPGLDGLEVLRRVSTEYLPSVIFVTAHDQYAVQAFQANAVDYLLKPYSRKRFEQAMARVRLELMKEVALAQTHQKVVRLLHPDQPVGGGAVAGSRPEEPYVQRVAVKDRDRYLIVKTDTIDWIDSAANYAQLHSGGRAFLLRTTMNELEGRLDPELFVRIHRATIVNVDRVREIQPSEHGDFTIVLRDGTNLRLSRTYRDRLLSRIYPYQRSEPPVDGVS